MQFGERLEGKDSEICRFLSGSYCLEEAHWDGWTWATKKYFPERGEAKSRYWKVVTSFFALGNFLHTRCLCLPVPFDNAMPVFFLPLVALGHKTYFRGCFFRELGEKVQRLMCFRTQHIQNNKYEERPSWRWHTRIACKCAVISWASLYLSLSQSLLSEAFRSRSTGPLCHYSENLGWEMEDITSQVLPDYDWASWVLWWALLRGHQFGVCNMSNEKNPGCFKVFIRDEILPSYVGGLFHEPWRIQDPVIKQPGFNRN